MKLDNASENPANLKCDSQNKTANRFRNIFGRWTNASCWGFGNTRLYAYNVGTDKRGIGIKKKEKG